VGASVRQRQSIEAAGEDGLDRAIRGSGVCHGARARGFESRTAVGLGEPQDVLCTAQPFEDPIAQQLLDQRSTARSDLDRLLQTPLPVVGEERSRLGRQVVGAGTPTTRTTAPQMRGDETVILKDRHRVVGGAQPQRLSDQGEWRGVQAVVELDMAVAMQDQSVPRAQIGRDRRERQH
jgi:hypothetical protein